MKKQIGTKSASARAKLISFVHFYTRLLEKMEESLVKKKQLLRFKATWKFCFTDSSVALTSLTEDALILTVDRSLRDWCKNRGIRAKDVYYDVYLSI